MRCLLILAATAVPAFGQLSFSEMIAGPVEPTDAQIDDWLGGSMALHTATWDNGETLTGSFVSTFNRDTATYDVDSQMAGASATAVGVDVRRYGGDIAVYGARALETLVATANNIRAYGSGYDSAGLPVVVYGQSSTPPVLVVARGGATFSTVTSKNMTGAANKPADTYWDLLAGEADEEADFAHHPKSVTCLNGIILVTCGAVQYVGAGSRTDAANWAPYGCSLVYSTDNGATWSLAWRTGSLIDTTPPSDFGAEWSTTCSHLARDGTNTDFWLTVASYASGSNRTADTIVCNVTGGLGAWAISNGHRINHTVGSGAITHEHYAVVFTDPANTSGLKLICELGDSAADNRTEEFLCSSASGFLTGASAMAGATNVVEGGSNWSGPVVINGKIGATAVDQQMSNQTISYAPGPNGGWYAGADEGGGSAIAYATVPATNGARVNWLHAYGFDGTMNGFTGANPYEVNWRCFTLNAWDYSASNPGVVGLIAPGNQWITGYEDITRIIYKAPNETVFGIVYAPQGETTSPEQVRPVLSPDGYIYLGSLNAAGLRRIPVPSGGEGRIQHAVFAGPGGTNQALATPTQVTAVGGTNSGSWGVDTPPVTFPSTAAVGHFIATATGTPAAGMGVWTISGDSITKTHTTLTVQVLVYTDTDAAIIDSTTYWRARFYTVEGGTGTATLYRGPNRMETRGHFTLLTFILNNGAAGTDDWDLSGLTAPLRLNMQIQTSSATIHPCEWWMQVVGVYEDIACPPSYFVPPATTGDNETLELSGFTCGNAWTVYATAVLGGETGRNCRSNSANTFREFLTLWQDATKYIELAWDADDQIRIRCTNGGNVTNTTLTGLPKFLRGDPMLFAMSYDGTQYLYSISVAGIAATSGTIANTAIVNPKKLLLSQDDDGTVRENTRWLYAAVNDGRSSGLGGLGDFVGGGDGDGGDARTRARYRRDRGHM